VDTLVKEHAHDLVQLPFVTSLREPAPDPIGELPAELERPLPHGLMADEDAAGG